MSPQVKTMSRCKYNNIEVLEPKTYVAQASISLFVFCLQNRKKKKKVSKIFDTSLGNGWWLSLVNCQTRKVGELEGSNWLL